MTDIAKQPRGRSPRICSFPDIVVCAQLYQALHVDPNGWSRDVATNPYESSVLWSRAYLEFNAGRRDIPPGMVGDGGRGGTSIIR
jgi:hypothetical protein